LAGAKAVVVIVTVLVVLVVLLLGWSTFRPDLFLNPIDRFIHLRSLEHGMGPLLGTTMVPEVFSIGEDGADAERRLVDAGYHWNGEEDGKVFYRKYGRNPRFLCQAVYFVTLEVDASGKLTDVEAQANSYCV
jgi:hypothetical protein